MIEVTDKSKNIYRLTLSFYNPEIQITIFDFSCSNIYFFSVHANSDSIKTLLKILEEKHEYIDLKKLISDIQYLINE